MRSDLLDGRRKKWQTCDDDAKQRFHPGHNAQPCDTIGVIIQIYLRRQDLADESDDANAVFIKISSIVQAGAYGGAYMMPSAKMIVSSIFLRVAICSLQIIGIGSRMMNKSPTMLRVVRAIRDCKVCSQTPGCRGFQAFESGRQVKTSLMITEIPYPDTKAMTANANLRKVLFERKIVM